MSYPKINDASASGRSVTEMFSQQPAQQQVEEHVVNGLSAELNELLEKVANVTTETRAKEVPIQNGAEEEKDIFQGFMAIAVTLFVNRLGIVLEQYKNAMSIANKLQVENTALRARIADLEQQKQGGEPQRPPVQSSKIEQQAASEQGEQYVQQPPGIERQRLDETLKAAQQLVQELQGTLPHVNDTSRFAKIVIWLQNMLQEKGKLIENQQRITEATLKQAQDQREVLNFAQQHGSSFLEETPIGEKLFYTCLVLAKQLLRGEQLQAAFAQTEHEMRHKPLSVIHDEMIQENVLAMLEAQTPLPMLSNNIPVSGRVRIMFHILALLGQKKPPSSKNRALPEMTFPWSKPNASSLPPLPHSRS